MAEDIGDISAFWDGTFPGLDAFGGSGGVVADPFASSGDFFSGFGDALSKTGDFFTSPGGAILALGGANAIGGLLTSNAARRAAELQANATGSAADRSMSMFNTIRNDLTPYQLAGLGAVSPLAKLTGTEFGGNPLNAALTKPFDPTIAQLEQTPGYKFTLDQGMKAIKNQFAARGQGGMSGALGKGLVGYAEGLAGTTYNDQLKNYLAQNQQIYNMLGGLVQGGQNAAVQTGNFGTQTASTAGNLLTSGAAATAAGQVGSANAMAGGLGNIGSTLVTNSLLQGMFGGR